MPSCWLLFLLWLTHAASLTETREAFNLYDKLGDGTIAAKDIPELLRAIGQNPLKRELDEIVNKIDPAGTNLQSR